MERNKKVKYICILFVDKSKIVAHKWHERKWWKIATIRNKRKTKKTTTTKKKKKKGGRVLEEMRK